MNPLFLVISDTHGDVSALKDVLVWAKDSLPCDAALFLGDGEEDIPLAAARAGFGMPWYMVRGNGDFDLRNNASLVLDTGAGSRIFMTHGNRYRVDQGVDYLAAAAKENEASAALFGHTHIAYRSSVNGILVLNPGSLGRPRSDIGPSFATLECAENSSFSPPFKAVFYALEKRGRVREIGAML